MPNKNGVVSIALNVDYQKSLQQMVSDFKVRMSMISNEAKKLDFSKDMAKQIGAVDEKIERISNEFKSMFDEINNSKLDASKFEQYQTKVSKDFEKIEKSISGIISQISTLDEKLGMLSGADFASSMKKQFDDLKEEILGTYEGLEKIFDLTKMSNKSPVVNFDKTSLDEYKKTLAIINKLNAEATRAPKGNWGQLKQSLTDQEALLRKQIESYDELKIKMESVDPSSDQYAKLENELVRIQAEASATADKIQSIFDFAEEKNFKPILGSGTEDLMLRAGDFGSDIDAFEAKVRKMVQSSKEAQNSVEQTQTSFNTFQIKNGAIHVPVEIATKSGTLQKQLQETIDKLQEYAQKNSVIAKVKLTLDGSSTSGYKKNSDIAKQLEDGQGEPAVDISKVIKKTYVQAVREAEKTAKDAIKAIQTVFDDNPIKITPDGKAFTKELSTMVNSALGNIAKDTTGLNVNEELEKLVTNLKEVSTSLSGNESFKFGLDEDSIKRITAAIKDMADMIQRAFGVASNEDIAAQWDVIKNKFKGFADFNLGDDKGKIFAKNKVVIQELAAEYKKYLDMGGKNDLSSLTNHNQTVKNITKAYEKLNIEAKESQNILDQNVMPKNTGIVLTPEAGDFKSDAEKLLDAINLEKEVKLTIDVSDSSKNAANANKKLAERADKTYESLKNEGDISQTTSEKLRELAEQKKAATDANLELGIAAEMTASALKKEAEAQKEVEERKREAKPNKNAVNESVYAENALDWQADIKQYLLDSGEYANIYESEISRAENGTVKFTATVKTMGDELNEVEGEWKKYTATVNSSGEISSFKLKDLTDKKSQKIEKEIELLRQLSEQADGEEKKSFDKSKLQTYVSTIIDATQALETFNTKYSVLVDKSGGLSIVQQVTQDNGQVETFTAKFRDVESVIAAITDETKSFKKTLEESFDSGSFSTSTKDFVSKAQDAFDKFNLKHKGDSGLGEINADLENLKNTISTIGDQKGLDKFKQDLSDLGTKLKNIKSDSKLGKIFDPNRTFGDINEVRSNIDSLFASMGKVNEKSIRIDGTDKLTAEVKAANGEIRKMTVSLDSNGFARFVDNGIVEFGRLRSAAEGVFKGIQSMVRIYLSPQDFIRYFRQGFDAVKEIDTAMTELRKVSDASPSDITAYFGDAVASAKELGSSVNEMIGATADWQRMGYNLPDSRELGEVAVLYKNVGDGIDVDTANESLVSTMQGFQLQAKDAMSVIDAFNEVSNNYAISSGGIGEALKRSAAAFNAANTDLNQSIALITAGNEIVQSPEKVGTMWQTVSARIRGTKTELEELGESTEDVLSTSKLQSLVKGYTGVDIMKDKDTYKDIYTIVSEIGKEWKNLTDIQRAALLEGLAGKKQSNTLAAVLNNAERLEEIYQTAENSMGSAQKEQDRYTQSLQYSLDQLTAHGEEFWNTFINKDDVKDFIDLINILISGATKLVDTFGSIPTLAGIFGGFAAIKNVGRPKMFGLKLLF